MTTRPKAAAGDDSVPARLIEAATTLLRVRGPEAITARGVAAEAGMSSMVVYSHFGGLPELVRAVADRGFETLSRAFDDLPTTTDTLADTFRMALQTHQFARGNPHLYDLMFGLSTRATYRPPSAADLGSVARSAAFAQVYAGLLAASERLVHSGRVTPADPEIVAACLWSFVHGFICLDLVGSFAHLDDAVSQVLMPLAVTFSVGMGADPDSSRTSHLRCLTTWREASPSAPRPE
jgi:AcrR family transcriptional regulator